MPRVSFNRLSKKKSSARRKRTGVLTRAKYKPRTTAANRSLIKSNAYAIRAVKRLMPSPVYTDWQYSATLFATPDPDGQGAFTTSLDIVPLMSPGSGIGALWQPVLRQDVNVTESSTTLVKRMVLNLRYTMQAANWAQYTTFVVTIRKDASNRAIIPTELTEGEDYIRSQGQEFNVRLNPAVFKVHYVRNVSLTKNTWLEQSAVVGQLPFAGNPRTTYAKGQCSMNLNYRIRQPIQGTSWTAMTQAQFPHNQRVFLMTFITSQSDSPTAQTGARLDF